MGNKLFGWTEGHQKTGYSIFTLALVCKRTPIPFDCYIIKYPTGSHIPPHRDALKGRKHYRINIILVRAKGGEFQVENAIFRSKRLNFFRPDIETHSVTPVTSGTRYVLSFGWTVRV